MWSFFAEKKKLWGYLKTLILHLQRKEFCIHHLHQIKPQLCIISFDRSTKHSSRTCMVFTVPPSNISDLESILRKSR
ncbi:hypothetical protein EUTSA_v10011117mg [Eutrema salsugineum]|uniref:Uncharacterized protein n=1 Tax=Eutrema salsugineum TaxID=72664 RepID=V4M141_EUTSA|nr:hypothetical protein EUTSA_v10011117mg [Eutrema salsugineum]